jgi:hypothetical protein
MERIKLTIGVLGMCRSLEHSSPSPAPPLRIAHFGMADLSLSGFVNVGKLEDVLQTLLQRMDAQQARIDQLERQAAQSVSLTSFQSLSHRLESTIDHMNTQFGAIDARLGEMAEEMANVQATLATLPALRATVDAKLDNDAGSRKLDELRTTMLEQFTSVKSDKASKSIVSSLETSQHRLVEEILAMQKMIACKIDRVEVPLLDVASEKLQFLLDFQQTADTRLEKAETDLSTLNRQVAQKESKDTHAKTVLALREELAKKVDGTFIKSEVLSSLHRAEDEVVRLRASEEVLDKLMEDYHAHIERFARSEKVLQEVRHEMTRVSGEYQTLVDEVGHKADFKAIDSIVFENADEIEKIVRTYETKAQQEAKVQSAYLADVRTQLEDMQKYQNTVDAKLQTALRFIDWFMDVKGKPQ